MQKKPNGTGGTDRLGAPFDVEIQPAGNAITVTLGKQTFTLVPGEWSDWIAVTFKVGPFRRMRGITRFHLASIEPAFGLYVSPVLGGVLSALKNA